MEVRPGNKLTDLGVIPDEWEVGVLGKSCDIVTKGTTPTSIGRAFTRSGIAFLKAESISESGNTIPEKIAYIDEITHSLMKRSQLKRNDVLISIAGVLGRVGYVEEADLPANTNQALAIIRLGKNSQFERCFLFYILNSPCISRQIRDINVQAAQANISLQDVRDFLLPTPPIPEQRAIAAALSDVDALLGGLDRLIAKKRDLKQATMQQLLTGKTRLPGFHGVWEVKTIDQVAFVTSGKRLPLGSSLVDMPTPHPYIRVTDMRPGTVDTSELMYVPESVFPSIKQYRIYQGDIFISVAGTLGIIGKIPAELDGANLTENADRITNIKCSQDYLLYVLLSPLIQNAIDSIRTVGAQPKLALARIRKFAIPLPPSIAEQAAIAAVLSDMDDELAALEARRSKTRDLKQAMMQELLTGRIRLP